MRALPAVRVLVVGLLATGVRPMPPAATASDLYVDAARGRDDAPGHG